PAALRQGGLRVTELVVYRTRLALEAVEPAAALLRAEDLDAITLTSGAAVSVLADAWQRAFDPPEGTARRRPVIGCIGPNTAAVARAKGLPVDVVPPRAGGRALVAALAAYFGGSGMHDDD